MSAARRETEMFGMTVEQMEQALSCAWWISSKTLAVVSLLSDVQEMIERDDDERARQALNRAKWMIDHCLQDKREQS